MDKYGTKTIFDNITTDRLIVRPAKSGDEKAIYSYRSDFNENKYQGWHPDSVEEVREHIETNLSQNIDVTDMWLQFAIIIISENKLIGDIGVNLSADKMQAEVGCTLDKAFQGKGYATEALGAMVDYLFLTLKKHRITASIDPRNTDSIRMVERLGFKKEAHFRESLFIRGEWVDDAVYAILEKEWVNTKKNKREWK